MLGGHAFGTNPVRHQPFARACRILQRYDHALAHIRMRAQTCLDLAQFDAEATDLDLVIVAAHKLDCAIGTPTPQIASAVHPRRRIVAERIGEEALGGQVIAIEIPTPHAIATDIQLAHHPDRNRRTVYIQDINTRIGERLSDSDSRIAFGILRQMFCSTRNRGLCRSIGINNFYVVRP